MPTDPGLDPGFRSVAIVPSGEVQRSAGLHQVGLISVEGHIVEDLDRESAAYLLKAIG